MLQEPQMFFLLCLSDLVLVSYFGLCFRVIAALGLTRDDTVSTVASMLISPLMVGWSSFWKSQESVGALLYIFP